MLIFCLGTNYLIWMLMVEKSKECSISNQLFWNSWILESWLISVGNKPCLMVRRMKTNINSIILLLVIVNWWQLRALVLEIVLSGYLYFFTIRDAGNINFYITAPANSKNLWLPFLETNWLSFPHLIYLFRISAIYNHIVRMGILYLSMYFLYSDFLIVSLNPFL